jgi:hypothetical protein
MSLLLPMMMMTMLLLLVLTRSCPPSCSLRPAGQRR